MKISIIALAAAVSVANAELVYENGEFKCLGDAANKTFCAGASLDTNIIIRCNGETGQPGNCNDNLAGIPPVGVKSFAPCYQTSNTTGDAACSYNGMVYPDSGAPFPVPGYQSSSPSSSSATEVPTSYEQSSSETSTTTTVTAPPTEYPTLPTTTYESSSTMHTVTGTITVTNCDTATGKACVPTGTGGPNPPANHTTYTTGLPIPTQIPSGAGAILAKDGVTIGAMLLIGLFFL